MFPLKNIPNSKMQPIAHSIPFDQLRYFVARELESIFPRLQNAYITYEILQILPPETLCSLRKVSRNHKAVVDCYFSLCSINIFFSRFDYYPKAENIQRVRISPGAMNPDTLESIMPTAPSVKWIEFQGNATICQEYLRQYFAYTGNIEILSFRGYFTLGTRTFSDAIKHNRKLRVIDLTLCNNLKQDTVRTICRKARLLEVIILRNCLWVERLLLIELLLMLPNLKKVSVSGCPKITADNVKVLRRLFKTVWIDF